MKTASTILLILAAYLGFGQKMPSSNDLYQYPFIENNGHI